MYEANINSIEERNIVGSTIRVGDINTPISTIDRLSRQRIRKSKASTTSWVT